LAAAQQTEQQKQNRFFVWQRSLGFGPPPELLVDSLQRIGGAQRLPLRKRESGKGEELVASLLEAGANRSAPQLPFRANPTRARPTASRLSA
jgi:hypothetical protein